MMKKYLSILILFSLFNSAFAMEVDSPIEKLYSIEAKDGMVVPFSKGLVEQCKTLKDMFGSLGELNEDEVIPVSLPFQSLQLLVNFHKAVMKDNKIDVHKGNEFGTTQAAQNELLEDKSLKETIGLFKVVDFLDYASKTNITNNVVGKIINPETIKAILMHRLLLDIAGERESRIVERLVHISKPLIAQYCISNNRPKSLIRNTHWVSAICVAGDRVISGSTDRTIKIWNIKTKECEGTLTGHSDEVNAVCVVGDRVISGSADRTIKIWNIATGECEHTIGHIFNEAITSIFVVGDRIISGLSNGKIEIWSIATKKCKHILAGHSDGVNAIYVAGDRMISGSTDRTIKIWNLATIDCECTLSGHEGKITSVFVDGDRIISGSVDGTIKIWNIKSGICSDSLEADSGVNAVFVDGNRVISRDDETIKIWNLATKRCEHTVGVRSGWSNPLCVAGDKVIIGTDRGTIKIWNIYDPNLEKALKYSSLNGALLGYYALKYGQKESQALIESSVSCKGIFDCCDSKLQKIICKKLAPKSLLRRLFTIRNALIEAGVIGAGIGLYAMYNWWFTSE